MDTHEEKPVERTCSAASPTAESSRRKAGRLVLLILQGTAYATATANSAIDIVSKLT